MKILPLIAVAFLAMAAQAIAANSQKVYTDADLMGMAGNPYNSGEVPLGDKHFVTDAPKKGYIYLCHVMTDPHGGGAGTAGPWIHGTSWNLNAKLIVQGQVNWANAEFMSVLQDDKRSLTGNGLPTSHPTGIFPIQQGDPVFAFDRNPSVIAPQNLHDTFPASPTYLDTPHCMGGEAGIMLTGVPLFNGFDAGMRDAPAHEAQDSCGGHPQEHGQYHYHNLSPCIKDISEKTVLGYALDGFPITGPLVGPGLYLTTNNLDECHGITSEINEDDQKKITYHYVMTQDFPYSVSCFRGAPVREGPNDKQGMQQMQQLKGQQSGAQATPPQGAMENGVLIQRGPQTQNGLPPMQPPGSNGGRQAIPPEAAAACANMSEGSNCGFTSPRGDRISGSCHTPLGLKQPICIPEHMGFQ